VHIHATIYRTFLYFIQIYFNVIPARQQKEAAIEAVFIFFVTIGMLNIMNPAGNP
jgi:hypothetical protein